MTRTVGATKLHARRPQYLELDRRCVHLPPPECDTFTREEYAAFATRRRGYFGARAARRAGRVELLSIRRC